MAVEWKKYVKEEAVILKSTVTAKGDIIVGTGSAAVSKLAIGTDGYILYVNSDTPGWKDPATLDVASHATTHKSGGADVIKLNELGAPTAAVNFNGQQFNDMVIHTVTDQAAREALTPVVGKMVWQTDELALYVCTSSA